MVERRPSGLYVFVDPKPPPPPAADPEPPRVAACPDCGGPTEDGPEHESRYTRICWACQKGFSFEAWGWLKRPDGVPPNRVIGSYPLADEA